MFDLTKGSKALIELLDTFISGRYPWEKVGFTGLHLVYTVYASITLWHVVLLYNIIAQYWWRPDNETWGHVGLFNQGQLQAQPTIDDVEGLRVTPKNWGQSLSMHQWVMT